MGGKSMKDVGGAGFVFITIILRLEGETENMCVWTKKRGSMNAVQLWYLWPLLLMATPCPKSTEFLALLHK